MSFYNRRYWISLQNAGGAWPSQGVVPQLTAHQPTWPVAAAHHQVKVTDVPGRLFELRGSLKCHALDQKGGTYRIAVYPR